MVTSRGHLWVVGFDDTARAAVFRDEIERLDRMERDLVVLDTVVAVHCNDGAFTVNGELFHPAIAVHGTLAHLLAALALGAPPLTGAAVCPLLGTVGAAPEVGISDSFIQEVQCLIKPGTSALFVLDEAGNLDAILRGIRGLGGTVLKTNVDLERARLIQSALSATADTSPSDGGESRPPGAGNHG
jgi:uncharacterized membrane protein